MPRKIDAGDVLALLGALLVLVGLFLDWFGLLNAWESLEIVDLLLALLALAVVAAALADVRGRPLAPGLDGRVLPWLGGAMLLLIALQLLQPPPAVDGDELETGAWLALAGAALVVIGGALRVARVSVQVSVGGRDVRHRVPAVDRRDAPPAGAAAGSPAQDPPTSPTTAVEPDPQRTQTFPPTPEQ